MFNFINEVKKEVETVYTFGTSIFRDLNSKQRKEFLKEFEKETGFKFTICSLEDENKNTVYGAIKNLNYNKNVAVLVVGGGSVEISICKNKRIIESVNSSFGVIDLYKEYSDIKEDQAVSNRDEIVNYIKEHLNLPKSKADILILAGGNHFLYHEAAKYPLEKNKWFEDEMHPYMIESKEKYKYDLEYYYNISLESLRVHTPNSPNWWNETRGICAFTKCVGDIIKAKYIIPTKINMMYHILDEVKKHNSKR